MSRWEDRVCCICDKHKKFLARVNAGQKLYCMECQAKLTKEHGSDYWKPCSFLEFMESMSSSMNNRTTFKEQLRQIKEEEKNNEKK